MGKNVNTHKSRLIKLPTMSKETWRSPKVLVRFGLVRFDSISTTVGFLIPHSFLYISTVLFQTIQFSMSTKLNDSKYCYV